MVKDYLTYRWLQVCLGLIFVQSAVLSALAASCDPPPPIMHGTVIADKAGDYYLPWEEVEVLCEPGYTYSGPYNIIMCKEDGQWEDVFRNCTEIFCSLPEPLANGTILELKSTNRTEFPNNYVLTYKCDKGYRLEGGDSWRLCGKNGWSGRNPYCSVIKCPDPGAPEYGVKEGHSYEVGAKVRFRCFAGYFLIGSIERHCMPNGQWTGELARCDTETNFCPDPGIPINGYKNSSNYDMGDIVGFGCRHEYIQVGSEARQCLPNRTWSGKETTCLGPSDFDNSAQVRDRLKMTLIEMATKQEHELKKFRETARGIRKSGNRVSRYIDLNYPGRMIIYFLFDVSGSVGQVNFDKSIDFAKAIVKRVGVSFSGARVGALTFSSNTLIEFLPLDFITTEEVINALDNINYTGGGTSITSALIIVENECIPLTQEVLGEKGQKSIIFVLTDGKNNRGGDPIEAARSLKEIGAEIYCIGITGSIKRDTLYKIASDSTDEQHVFILENYFILSWLIQELTNGSVDYSQCGLAEDLGQERVSQEVRPWPWMAALYFSKPTRPDKFELKCGGTVINRFFILTGAICMFLENNLRNSNNVLVKLGLYDLRNETLVQEPEVKSILVHPNYRSGSGNYDYDIALLQLRNAIEFNPYVRPICLPPAVLPEKSNLYKPGEYAIGTGWGHQGKVEPSSSIVDIKMSVRLKEIILPIQSREACNQSLVNRRLTKYFSDRMFCAGDEREGDGTCAGDSGGPLMQSQLNEEGYLYWTQVGIISWGIGCSFPDTFGFYSNVSNLRMWIDEKIKDALPVEL